MMKFSDFSRSLRLQFIVTLMLIWSPILIISISVMWALQATTNQFGEISRELTHEIRPAIEIQLQLGSIEVEIGRYLIRGDEHSRQKLLEQSTLIAEGLKGLLPEYFDDPEERKHIAHARETWVQAKTKIESTVKAPTLVRFDATQQKLVAELSQAIHDTIAVLDRIHGEAAKEIEQEHQNAQYLETYFAYFAVLLLVIGIDIVILATYLANRALFAPIARFRHAGERFAAGDLDFRLNPERSHEFQSLVITFNGMARELANQRQQLQDLAIRDGLTGLYNHTEFGNRLIAEWADAKRRDANLALIMLDLDHFKAINDTHGHPTGDQVLGRLSETLVNIVRPNDVVARYGGEEFAVLLPDADPIVADEVASRIQGAIREMRCLTSTGVSLSVTASIGVASKSDILNSPEILVRAADEALYQAKRGGRDQVRVHVAS